MCKVILDAQYTLYLFEYTITIEYDLIDDKHVLHNIQYIL